jgi:hypothetical protein
MVIIHSSSLLTLPPTLEERQMMVLLYPVSDSVLLGLFLQLRCLDDPGFPVNLVDLFLLQIKKQVQVHGENIGHGQLAFEKLQKRKNVLGV